MDNLDKIHKLLEAEIKYRRELLEKYSDILSRSEDRVSNVNKMVANLTESQRMCSERVDKLATIIEAAQENEKILLQTLREKDARIDKLEAMLDHEKERYSLMIDRLMSGNSKNIDNVFNLAKS